jgi:5,10-methylenetetrahydromethanopterin reductase
VSGRELSIAFQTDKSPAEYAGLGSLVDRCRFDVVSVYNDLFFQPALGPLLLLARHVTRARLGPAALNPFTLHPVEIAGQIAFLDAVTDGRAYLGLARGAWLDTLGVPLERPLRRLRESIEVVRRLLDGRTDGYVGEIFSLPEGATLKYELPRGHVPITLGTWGERTARTLGALVDEVKIGGSTNPRLVARMREWLPERVGICAGAVSVVDRDRPAARALARREVAMYLSVVAALDVTNEDPEWLDRIRANGQDYASISRDISDAQLERFAFAGSPDDIVRQVHAVYTAGATRVEFGTPHGLDAATGVRLLGEAVLPELR